MPNLYNSDLAQNARRVRIGDSNIGTRKLQLYEVSVIGLTDDFVNSLNGIDARDVEFDGGFMGGGIDQYDTIELKTASIVEAVVRGVQKISEVYIVGFTDVYPNGPGYTDLVITIGVAADTIESGWEQYVRGDANNNSESIQDSVYNAVDEFDPPGGFDYVYVQPVQLIGSGTYDIGGPPIALPAKLAAYQAKKDARAAKSAPPQSRRNPG
jgi:hypothetical protein